MAKAPHRTEKGRSHPNSANPFGMLYLTRYPDNFHVYIRPENVVSIERLPAVPPSSTGTEMPERTKIIYAKTESSTHCALVIETPEEIFEQKIWLDGHSEPGEA